eukprot:NODE_858_length_744_cov_458.976978_g657_i0.p1 GENE.NODE_858_length_744_cov_458.976978_g657_i0~~NODE_858_length_744_cov_458.976978_g657_i0.p1  ORF type:complete len:217 (-),score=29.50 NODE_858_length_744_cov_458.976978_g657_i0:60-710(-)
MGADGTSPPLSFIGWSTLRRFWAFPHKERLRINQFCILPPYQRNGHGWQLLDAIYATAESRQSCEVCVEACSLQLAKLRNVVDAYNCKRKGFFQKWDGSDSALEASGVKVQQPNPDPTLLSWNETTAQAVQGALRIHKEQVRKCFEIFLYRETHSRSADEARRRVGRLRIKERLFRLNESDISELAKVEEKKEMLNTHFEHWTLHYQQVLRKMGDE